jgi:hypothetical protein
MRAHQILRLIDPTIAAATSATCETADTPVQSSSDGDLAHALVLIRTRAPGAAPPSEGGLHDLDEGSRRQLLQVLLQAACSEHGLEAQDIAAVFINRVIRDGGPISHPPRFVLLCIAFSLDELDACGCQLREAPTIPIHQPPASI